MHIALDCLVVGRYPSGVERAVVGLLEGLAVVTPNEHRITALMRPQFRPDAAALAPVRTHLAPTWTRWRPGRVLYEQALMGRLLRRLQADLLHGTAYVLPLRWEGPSVVTIHDTVTLTHPRWCKPLNVRHYRAVMTRSARRASVIVVPSRHAQEQVVRHLGVEEARTRVVPLGAGEEFQPVGADALQLLRDRHQLPDRYLLCVGNLEPRKNLPAIIQAFQIFAEQAPHALVLAGKRGWRCRPIFEAMQDSSVADRITWLGWVPQEDLPALYAGAEALVQWSLDEGFGLTPLEAMACGTPAVISDAGALVEVAGDAALMVPLSAGPEGLARELLRLTADDALRAQLIERGRRHAAGFTWHRHAERMMQIYEEVGREAAR